MFRRGMAGLTMAGIMLFAIGIPAAMADTSGGNNVNLYFAYANSGAGPISAGINVQLGTIDGTKMAVMEAGTSTSQEIACKGKGKTGEIFTSVYGRSQTAVIKVDKKLGTATASAKLTLTENVYNSCTGKETQRDLATATVTLDLHATTGMTTTKSHWETTYPDGSKEVFNGKFDSREAAGGFRIGATDYSADSGQIEHDVSTYVIVPPAHH